MEARGLAEVEARSLPSAWMYFIAHSAGDMSVLVALLCVGVEGRGELTVRGDIPEQLLCRRDEEAVLRKVGGDGVQREKTEAHEEGCRFNEEPHGHHGCEESEGG